MKYYILIILFSLLLNLSFATENTFVLKECIKEYPEHCCKLYKQIIENKKAVIIVTDSDRACTPIIKNINDKFNKR